MSERSRRVLLGFKTNIKRNEHTYHIQTEDNGLDNPVIISLLYLQGGIIATKNIGYVDMAGEADYEEKIKRLMTEQHSSMIEELLARRYTEQLRSGNKGEGR